MKAIYSIAISACLSSFAMERPPQAHPSSSEETMQYEPILPREQISVPAIPSSDGSSTTMRGKRKEQVPIRSLKKQRGQEESFSIAYYLKTNPQLILGKIKGNTLDLSYLNISSLDGLAAIPGIARVTHLGLAHNLIREIKREDFIGVGHLISLDLSNNLLEFLLADSFAELGNLINLFLNDNIIRTLQHDAFTGLNNLKQLSLSRNRIKELDDKMLKGVFNLEELDLSKNEIAILEPHTFVSLSFLKKLKLNNNQIIQLTANMFEGFKLKGQSFNGLRYLELLDLRNNKLTEIPTSILTRMPALAQLLLSNNQIARITDQNVTALKKALNLKKIDVTGNQLSDPAIKKLRQALPNVEIIATAPMEISENVEKLMSEFSATKSISDLESQLRNQQQERDTAAAHTLSSIAPISLRTYLNKGNFKFEVRENEEEDVERKKSYDLQRLELTSLDGLLDLPHIHEVARIYLNGNQLKHIGAHAFFGLNHVEEIMLGSNEIETIDPRAFEGMQQLKAVYLYSNKISALTPEIMHQFKNIKILDLGKNQLRSLNPSLFVPLKNLTFLDLTGNPLSQENVKAIQNALPNVTVSF